MAMPRWYQAIGCDNTVEDPLVIDEDSLPIDPVLLRIGKPVTEWGPSAYLMARKPEYDGEPDDVLQNCLNLPVFSRRMRDALAIEGISGFQYLPVRVLRPNGVEIPGFCFANILERRRALDRQRSSYAVFPDDYFLPQRRGLVRAIYRRVLVGEQLQGCDVLRLDEYYVSIFVSDRFKQTFEAWNLTGYSFAEVEVS